MDDGAGAARVTGSGPDGESAADAARRAVLSAALAQSGTGRPVPGRTLQDVLPPLWGDRAVVGLDAVVRAPWLRLVLGGDHRDDPGHPEDRDQADSSGLADLPVQERSSADLLALAEPFLRGRSGLSAQDCLRGLEAMHVLMCRMSAGRLQAAGELSVRAGEVLLEEDGLVDAGELSRTRRERWRRRARMIAADEVAALTGWGRGRSRELVAVSLTPVATRSAIRQGLSAGVASWSQVDKFWRATRVLAHEDAAAVARSLFATDVTVEEAAKERVDPDGALRTEPWQEAPFIRALAREVTRVRGADPAAEARRRAAQRRERNAYAVVDDDGSGQVVITGGAADTAACADRLHLMATRLRAGGDLRTLAQLRADLGRALLLHGTLPLHGTQPLGDDATPFQQVGDDLISPEELERLAQVVTGTPSHHLQVIVPWDALTGAPVPGTTCTCGGCTCGAAVSGTPRAEPGSPSSSSRSEGGSSPPSSCGSAAVCPSTWPVGRVREGVGHVLSRTPVFLTGAELRAMALAPGTTLSRILFDPADGRCVERSVARYRPDRAMREQIRAADVTSRGYGSATLARDCQLDHVLEYLAGGATSEPNLQSLDLVSHLRKTRREWTAVIDPLRNVTWTSLFGRLYRTRVHDYRQYLSTGAPPTAVENSPTDAPMSGTATGPGPLDRQHLASLLVYAALTARQVGQPLEAPEDDPDGDDEVFGGRRHPAIWVRRTRGNDGRKVDGPRPGTPTPEQIIATPASTILRAAHWTDPFRRAPAPDGEAPGRPVDVGPPPF